MVRFASVSVMLAAILPLSASGSEPEKPAQVKVAAVQMLGYDKTDMPRPGFDPSEAVVRYVERAAKDEGAIGGVPGDFSHPLPERSRVAGMDQRPWRNGGGLHRQVGGVPKRSGDGHHEPSLTGAGTMIGQWPAQILASCPEPRLGALIAKRPCSASAS